MFCPNCGQEKLGPETNFCSKCGFLLTGTAALLQTGGEAPQGSTVKRESARKRGLKQGLFIFLLTFLVVPIVAMISQAIHIGPGPTSVAAVVFFMGGLLRMAYALLFEQNDGPAPQPAYLSGTTARPSLPPQQSVPASAYTGPGNWRDTNDLEPISVTENTTRLLERDEMPPQ